jgi:hypothetical protein
MSITYDHGDIVISCDGDGCHDTLETMTSNFGSAINTAKRARYVSRKPAGTIKWEHFCPVCASACFSKAMARGRQQQGKAML